MGILDKIKQFRDNRRSEHLFDKIADGHPDVIVRWLKEGGDPNVWDSGPDISSRIFARHKDLAKKQIFDSGRRPGWTLLHYAVSENQQLVDLLLSHGADPDAISVDRDISVIRPVSVIEAWQLKVHDLAEAPWFNWENEATVIQSLLKSGMKLSHQDVDDIHVLKNPVFKERLHKLLSEHEAGFLQHTTVLPQANIQTIRRI